MQKDISIHSPAGSRGSAGHPKSPGRRVAQGGILLAVALILSYVESLIPISVGIPGVKLGLPNLITVLGLITMSPLEVLAIIVMRNLLSGFMFGSGMTIIYSLAGGVLSWLVMTVLMKTKLLSVIPVSISGGITHNLGQLIIAYFVLRSEGVWYYFIPLFVAGSITGFLIGIIALRLKKYWVQIFK